MKRLSDIKQPVPSFRIIPMEKDWDEECVKTPPSWIKTLKQYYENELTSEGGEWTMSWLQYYLENYKLYYKNDRALNDEMNIWKFKCEWL